MNATRLRESYATIRGVIVRHPWGLRLALSAAVIEHLRVQIERAG
jgi:hypothetical protein